MENLHFDKEGYFHVLVFYGLFYKRNIKYFFTVFPYVIETPAEVWENSKLCGNSRPMGSCSDFNFSFSQTFTHVSLTVWKHRKCFLFLNYKIALSYAHCAWPVIVFISGYAKHAVMTS